jgi:hypothetical protein
MTQSTLHLPARLARAHEDTNMDTPPKPLPGPIRRRINLASHAVGLRSAEAARSDMTEQVRQARDSGAGFDQMLALLAEFQASPV